VPDPDRRVGGLRAPAPRPERPAGGGFETQFTFAQVLTESAKLAGNCLLVISLPASDTSGSPHTQSGRRRGRRYSAGARRSTGSATWSGASSHRGARRAPKRASRSCAGASSSPCPSRRSSRTGTWSRGLRRPLPHAAGRVPARVPRMPTTRSASGRVPDPPGDLRPALQRLVDAGEVPAHAWRAAPDGGGDPQSLGEGRQATR
jgi:hypothetical protein